MVRRMISVSDDPALLARIVSSAETGSAVRQQFQEVVRELSAVSPELAVDLELAQKDPVAFVKAIRDTLDKLDEVSPLTMAVQDYERIGLGVPCSLSDGVELVSGKQVVARVQGYMAFYQITKTNGAWLFVERLGGDKAEKGWTKRDNVTSLIPYLQVVQKISTQ